jgi:hypothetical protein
MTSPCPTYGGSEYTDDHDYCNNQDTFHIPSEDSTTPDKHSLCTPLQTDATPTRRQHIGLVERTETEALCIVPQVIDRKDRDSLPCQIRQQDLPLDFPLIDRTKTNHNQAIARVQPTNNPYHWEAPTECNQTMSAWAKASWLRTTDIVRQKAGTLSRKAAVRRGPNKHAASTTPVPKSARSSLHQASGLAKRKMHHHSFSFENGDEATFSSTALEQITEEPEFSAIRTDSVVGQVLEGRTSRFHERFDAPPYVPRTFAEILGDDHFIPTALVNDGEEKHGHA